ncbi:MAG: fused MFS/spermidine synthase [Caldilineaceae bacterium]
MSIGLGTGKDEIRYLGSLTFMAGVVALGIEISAARLLEPVFGNNQIIWAALIGMVLFYLATGAWLGGRLADRWPATAYLTTVAGLAAGATAVIPMCSAPILRFAAAGVEQFAPGMLMGALLSILLLFSLPCILLGAIGPWAIRLSLRNLSTTGNLVGRFYALSTAGSILGAFLPALWLIPTFGTRWTFTILALALLCLLVLGNLGRKIMWLPLALLMVILFIAIFTHANSSVRRGWDDGSAGNIIYEDESRYNYIAVRQWGNERHLKLNDGIGIHSVYHPDALLSQGIWDYFLLAPYWRNASSGQGPSPNGSKSSIIHDALVIGLAAGTVSELLTKIYGPIPIVGVELDPQIIEVGRTYFDMNQPNLTPIAADGRYWLAQQPTAAKWDMIAVDAYRPPYIPFHLTTVEFFQLVQTHLNADGVVAINVGRTANNFALVDAMTATLAQVFPTVFVIDEPGPADNLGNSLVVATMQPATLAQFHRNIEAMADDFPAEFRTFAQAAAEQTRQAAIPAQQFILTDDHAPVEQIVHSIILDFFAGR